MRWASRAAVATVCLATAGGVSGGVYTLDELVAVAYKNSKTLKSVEKEIVKADAQIKEALGSAFPTVDASANFQHSFKQYSPFSTTSMGASDPQQAMQQLMEAYGDSGLAPYVGAFQLSPEDLEAIRQTGPTITSVTLDQIFGNLDFDSFVKDNTIALSLTAQQVLFAQGKVLTGLKIARSYRTTLADKYDEEKQKLKAGITKLFYGALVAQKGQEIQQEAVALAKETHRLTVARLVVGKGSELDTLGSRLRYENAIIDEQKAESGMRLAYEALILQAEIDETAGTFSIQGDFPAADFEATLDQALAAMKASNLAIKQLEETEEIQHRLVTLAKSDFLPMVYCGGSIGKIYQYNAIDEVEWGADGYNDQKVFVGMKLNLFNGLKTPQKLRQARADEQKFILTRKQAEEGLELAVKNAYEKFTLSRDQLAAMENVLRLAQKGYDVSKIAYEVGSRTLLDMENAELELNKAKIGYAGAQVGYHQAVIDLKLLMGQMD